MQQHAWRHAGTQILDKAVEKLPAPGMMELCRCHAEVFERTPEAAVFKLPLGSEPFLLHASCSFVTESMMSDPENLLRPTSPASCVDGVDALAHLLVHLLKFNLLFGRVQPCQSLQLAKLGRSLAT